MTDFNDIQVGMPVSAIVGNAASITATGLVGAQISAALGNQGVAVTRERETSLSSSFHAKGIPEQATRSLATPQVAPSQTLRVGQG